MTKTITKIGNSQGIIFDSALLELAHLKTGDQVNVTVHDGGAIIISPLKPGISKERFEKELDGVLCDYRNTLKKLA